MEISGDILETLLKVSRDDSFPVFTRVKATSVIISIVNILDLEVKALEEDYKEDSD